MHGHPAFVLYMLYVTTAFRHALRGETVNDAIFLDSSQRRCDTMTSHALRGLGIQSITAESAPLCYIHLLVVLFAGSVRMAWSESTNGFVKD